MSEQEKKKEEYSKTVYKYDGKKFDAIEGYTDKKMQEMLASFFPEVANAKMSEEIKNGVRTVTFTKQAGRLGGSVEISEKVLKCQPVEDIMPVVRKLAGEIYSNPLGHVLGGTQGKLEEITDRRMSKNKNIIERMKSICPRTSEESTLIA